MLRSGKYSLKMNMANNDNYKKTNEYEINFDGCKCHNDNNNAKKSIAVPKFAMCVVHMHVQFITRTACKSFDKEIEAKY